VRLVAKLKSLKGYLKEWHTRVFGKVEGRIAEQIDALKHLDLKAEVGILSPEDSEARFKGFHDLWALLRVKESQIFQQSRTKWLREGDANSGYIHVSTKIRRRRNSILALRVGSRWVENVQEVRAEIVGYFRDHFSDPVEDRPTFDGVPLPCLSEVETGGLVVPFSDKEIRRVVLESDGAKSPGPDGFNFSFYKRFWELFNQFFQSAILPRCFSSYFITLIPKVVSPTHIGDFRPISLLGSLYKLMAKVLAGRLAPIMDKLISSNQSAFLKGRQLMDSVVAINEVIDAARKGKRECLIFKVDFEKACDSVSWSFVNYMMRRLGFSDRLSKGTR